MYYRPREKKRGPLLTFLLSILLLVLMGVLVIFIGMLMGYIEFYRPDLTRRFEPSPTPTRPAILYIADGDTYFTQGKLKEAINAYEEAIRLDPDNDIPYIRQSRLLVYTRDTAKAVEKAAQAVTLNSNSPENLAYYCRALDWEAQYGAAYDACSCAMELDPQYAEAYAFLSEVYADQGYWGQARETAQQALDANFQSMDAHHNMGYALEVQGRYVQAAEFYENAVALAPNLAPLYVHAGQMYFSLGDYETAANRYKRAIKLSPFDPEAYTLLGRTYYANGDYTRAIDALEQSLGLDPDYVSSGRGESAWGYLGLIYYTRQNFEKSIELFPRAIELGERQFLRRARKVEIYAESQTLTGQTAIPILRGGFTLAADPQHPAYVTLIEPVVYTSSLSLDPDQSCGALIADSIEHETSLMESTQSLSFTQTFSGTKGTARLDLVTGQLSMDLTNMPPPISSPYEIRVTFWPNRTESVGYFQPEANRHAQASVQFEKDLTAPVEYYYLLGLSYAYLDPPLCEQAVPWLLKSLKLDSSGYSPAWAGLRICPSVDSPPTPIPTFTPMPEEKTAQ